MAQPRSKKTKATETDSAYFLKLLLYFMVGLVWIKVNGIPILPIGLLAGLLFSTHEHFQIDRKIEYAVLLISALLGLSTGVFINVLI